MKHVKRQPREKRLRVPVRASRAQVHYLHPDPDKPHRVKVYISPTRLHMRATVRFVEGRDHGLLCMGQVWSWEKGPRKRAHLIRGAIVGRMYLNTDDLRRNATEIPSHECTHAAMAWARLQRANLSQMPGEEVMCYAQGRMMRQLTNLLYAVKIFP